MATRTDITVRQAIQCIGELLDARDLAAAHAYAQDVFALLDGQLTGHDYYIIGELFVSAERVVFGDDLPPIPEDQVVARVPAVKTSPRTPTSEATRPC